MKKLILSLLVATTTLSANAQEECQITEKNANIKITLGKNTPEYFFKSIMPKNDKDKRNQATVILANKGNVLLDLTTGEVKKIPGPFDAVPSMDGNIITVPGNPENDNAFTIYSRDDMSKPLYEDKGQGALVGVYQSVGTLESKENKKTYRVITDVLTPPSYERPGSSNSSKLMYKDYDVEGTGSNMRAGSSEVAKPLCFNLNASLKLPMLSKDGKQLAAYSSTTGTTQIYKIAQDSEGNSTCKLERDLGFASTKVEFNKDSTKITFAADSMATTNRKVNWYAQPILGQMNMNVYVLDLKTNKLNKISNNEKGNSYYPSFSRDDTVTYLNQENKGGEEEYSLVQARIDNKQSVDAKSVDFYSPEVCSYSKEELATIALGKLWFKTCSKMMGTPTVLGSRAQALSMDPKKCEALVKKNWENTKANLSDSYLKAKDKALDENYYASSQVQGLNSITEENFVRMRNLTEDDLLQYCPKAAVAAVKAVIKPIDQKQEIKNAANILIAKCSGCHSNGTGRSFVVGDVASMKKNKMNAINYVAQGYMPMGAPLSREEKLQVMNYINDL